MNPGQLIGREYELAHLRALLASGARLVTVLGVGGCGKTALVEALLASPAVDETASRVIFCDCTTARTDRDFVRLLAVAAGVGLVGLSTAEDALDVIAKALDGPDDEPCRALVVCDNFEPIVGSAEATVGRLLARAHNVRVVATSREQLGLSLETCLALGPLAVPEAVRLFVRQARRVRPDFESSEEDLALISRIVVRLDGLPLALVLAASRMAELSLEAVGEGLRSRFDLLRTDSAEVGARHANLRATIGWSWDTLLAEERRALAQCAVFRGGFTPMAAEAIVRVPAPSGEAPPSLAGVLESLRRKSFLQQSVGGAPGLRFRLLETIRELVALQPIWDQLRTDCLTRHALYYVSCAEALTGGAAVRNDERSRDWFSVEIENLLAAAENALEPRPDLAARGLIALFPMLESLAIGAQHLPLAKQAVEAAQRSGDRALLARALTLRAKVHPIAGHVGAAADDCESALLLVEGPPHTPQRVLNVALLAYLRLMQEQLEPARQRYREAEQALTRLPPTSSDWAAVTLLLSVFDAEVGETSAALQRASRAVRVLRQCGDPRRLGVGLNNIGDFAVDVADLDLAEEHLTEALRVYAEHGLEQAGSLARTNLGIVAHLRGQLERASLAYEQAMAMARAANDERLEAFVDGYRGLLAAEEGDLDRASTLLSGAASALRGLDYRGKARIFEAFLGAVHLRRGDLDGARTCCERASDGFRADTSARVAACLRVLGEGLRTQPTRGALPRRRPLAADATLIGRLLNTASPWPATERLDVATDGSWFRRAGRAPVPLGRRQAARLLLLALAEHAAAGEAQALSVDQLFETGWPRVRIGPESAAKRVYTTIHDLRELGLKRLLVTRGDGYRLDAAITFETKR